MVLLQRGRIPRRSRKWLLSLSRNYFAILGKLSENFVKLKFQVFYALYFEFFRHKNIVGLLDIMRISNKNEYNEIYLVLQYMQYNLKKFIHSRNQITQNMIKFILYQILDGLQHMHSGQIIHRDLKPQNILINSKLQLKIADMNLARKQDDNPTRYVVTRPYRALEVFLSTKSYTKAIDVWSVGCIFAELIGRTVLFEGIDYLDQLKRFVAILGKPNLDYYDGVDQSVKESFLTIINQIPDRNKIDWKTLYPNANPLALDLLDHMLQYDPKKRYTAQQCMNHPFLKQLRQKNQIKRCEQTIDFAFDQIPMEIENIRKAIYEEVRSFHPDMEDLYKEEEKKQELQNGEANHLDGEEDDENQLQKFQSKSNLFQSFSNTNTQNLIKNNREANQNSSKTCQFEKRNRKDPDDFKQSQLQKQQGQPKKKTKTE